MCVISLINQKGGVSKSTGTYILGFELARLGKKVLLVDEDPQMTFTNFCNRNPDLSEDAHPQTHQMEIVVNKAGSEADPAAHLGTLMGLQMTGRISEVKDLLEEFLFPVTYQMKDEKGKKKDITLDILRSSIGLADIEGNLDTKLDESGQFRRESDLYVLKNVLDLYRKDYDYILIDAGPSLNSLAYNSLAAADYFIVPFFCSKPAIDGIGLVAETGNLIRNGMVNPNLKLLTLFCTMERPKQEDIFESVREMYGDSVFPLPVRESYDISRACDASIPLGAYKRGKACKVYESLAREIIQALEVESC